MYSEAKLREYTFKKNLGSGISGFVKAAVHSDGTSVAIKYISKRGLPVGDIARDRKLGIVPREVIILKKLSHQNIIRILDTFEDADFFYVVMESPPVCCDLFDIVDKCRKISEVRIRRIFRQIVSAVAYLHSINIVHGDIKDENVVVDANDNVYLVDFGSAKDLNSTKLEEITSFRGTLNAASPEVIRGECYPMEQDIWALGILFFTLLFNKIPFHEKDIVEAGPKWKPDLDAVLIEQYDYEAGPLVVNLVETHRRSEGIMDLLRKLLEPDVEKRITVQDIVNHPWMQTSTLLSPRPCGCSSSRTHSNLDLSTITEEHVMVRRISI